MAIFISLLVIILIVSAIIYHYKKISNFFATEKNYNTISILVTLTGIIVGVFFVNGVITINQKIDVANATLQGFYSNYEKEEFFFKDIEKKDILNDKTGNYSQDLILKLRHLPIKDSLDVWYGDQLLYPKLYEINDKQLTIHFENPQIGAPPNRLIYIKYQKLIK